MHLYYLIVVSVNRKIFNAALVISIVTFGTKLVLAAKDLLVAAYFGTSEVIDAFVIAYLLPSLSVGVVAASFGAALIPVYLQVKERQGDGDARELLSRASGLILLVLCALAFILFLLSEILVPLLANGFATSKLSLTRGYFVLLLPVIALSGFASVLSSLLNAGQRFILAAAAPAIIPVCIIGAVALLPATTRSAGLVWGTVVGSFLQLLILCWGARAQNLVSLPKFPRFDTNLRLVTVQFSTILAGSLLMSFSDVVDQAMAASLGSGSVATLSYGNKVVSLLLGVGAMGLGTAIFPYFSEMVAKNEWREIRHTLRVYIRLILLTTVPLCVALWLSSELLVRILFERGSFTLSDTLATTAVQRAFILEIPFYVLTILFVRLISSLRLNHFVVASTIVSVVLNVTLNYFFMQYFGVMGIALSTSIVYAFASISLGSILWLKLPRAP